MSDRFVVLGLAGSRARWFADVSRWAHAGSLPVEFVKCISVEQLRVRLRSGRTHSAAIIDADSGSLDRDVLHDIHAAGVAVIVVDAERDHRWHDLGADAVLSPTFGPDELLECLRAHAALVASTDWRAQTCASEVTAATGRLIAVCGPGGTGGSIIAAALAQQTAARNAARTVVLADLCRHAEQGMLHDAGDVGPGIQELVDQSRTNVPEAEQTRAHTYLVEGRDYALLLGLRSAAAWSTLRPRAVGAALVALRRAFDVVVCDCDDDFEGHELGGSWDVEERNALSRAAATAADVVVAVGVPGLKGVHSLGRVIGELTDLGVRAERIVPVFNQVSRGGRTVARLAKALLAVLPEPIAIDLAPVVIVPERDIEKTLHDGRRLPAALGDPVATETERVLRRVGAAARSSTNVGTEARPIAPGELATWTEELATP